MSNQSLDPAAANARPPSPDGEQWEIAEQWRLAWRSLKWAVAGFVAIGALIAVGQVYLFHQMFADIHPTLGWGFSATVAGLCAWFIGLPLARFFKVPSIARAPDVDLNDQSLKRADLDRRIVYDLSYLKGMAGNEALKPHRDEISKAFDDLTILKQIIDADAAKSAVTQKGPVLAEFERERIAPLLKDIDKQIDDYIHKEALAVGAATAVSLNGSVDALIVLWRNINMVARISRLYYGRPSLRLSLVILRDVLGAALLSRALDDITDAAGEALGGLVGKIGGMVTGGLLDGSVNALVTTKIGYLAKRRCRSFDVWSEAAAEQAAREVFAQVKRESAGLVGEIVKISGGVINVATDAAGGVINVAGEVISGAGAVAADVAGKAAAAPKSAWSMAREVFAKKSDPAEPKP